MEKVTDEEMKKVDYLIDHLEVRTITDFAKLCQHQVFKLLWGEIKSYRLAVVKHQEVKLDGVRLMKHHLPMHNIHCGSGNFTDAQRLAICEVAETFVNCDDMFTLVHSVLEYTIILWATIGFGELKPAQARYYLLHGGEDRKTEAYIAMERKCMVFWFI